jgi:hypothetical protein
MNLEKFISEYENTKEFSRKTHDEFCELTNTIPELKELRDWVEQNIFGFGERSFYWMWKMIVDEMPQEFTFLEIGVFRGQTTTLIQILAKLAGKKAIVIGITPLDNTGGHWESDYEQDLETIAERFKATKLKLIKGLSTDPEVIGPMQLTTFNLVYIDGGHSYEVAKSDIENFAHLTTDYLIIDDSANKLQIAEGLFAGIESVSNATDELLPPYTANERYQHLFNVVHNRVWKVTK